MKATDQIAALKNRIRELEAAASGPHPQPASDAPSVKVPAAFDPYFRAAEQTVKSYFSDIRMRPSEGTIEISGERYVLVRASAFSKDFLDSIRHLYADRGQSEAFGIGRDFLFDISHAIGINDAKAFHAKMNVTDPLSRLSAGPVHFAYTGWAFVDILPDSTPSPDDRYFLHYHHPFSFEADAWVRAGVKSDAPVCIMSAGYSTGWCQESFGLPLTAVEVSCRAKGDAQCTFVMSPPHKINEHLQRLARENGMPATSVITPDIPTFFLRKTIEEQLEKARVMAEESSRTKSEFVANMSHELRTPLTAILGFTELLKKTRLSARQNEYLEAISTSGSNLLATINDIMDLSKLDAGKISVAAAPLNIPQMLHAIGLMLDPKVRSKDLQYTLTIDEPLAQPLLGDSMRVSQILLNIISNAVKFTEKGGVTISCTAEADTSHSLRAVFRIRDTGIGISAAKQASVFERFTQADTAISRKYGGSGLGLAIARELAQIMGGSITLESKPGKGSEFTVKLPFVKAPAHEDISQPEATVATGGAGCRVLVVEDNVLNQKMTRLMLENNGYTAFGVNSGTKALTWLRKNTADVILMDIQIPGMDGYAATRKIRSELGLQTPIIAITAHAFSGEKEKCIAAGMNGYLSKPFRENELLSVIAGNRPAAVADLRFLREQTRHNAAFMQEMIRTFAQQAPKDLKALEKAAASGNGEQLYKIAHTMSTSAGFFGLAEHIGGELRTLQQTRMAEPAQLQKIRRVIEQAIAELAELTPSALSSAS
ncbi:ATP-binding protein [Chitinophaga rhizosphaerae]|uniref:ATP-binding protein n=1 Tax=Chitinophaga rhizosphaerae TaxID=1864947 RepID=UPI000F80A6F3|nr:ATP-binding protein [Chitinophaga rhizosphaerae]